MNVATKAKTDASPAVDYPVSPVCLRRALAILTVVVLAAAPGSSARTLAVQAREDTIVPPPAQELIVQQECPVMIGGQIDPGIFTVHRGKRVYFCCASCKSEFEKSPEKYLHRLPQFAAATLETHEPRETHEHADGHVNVAGLIEPAGVVTLSLVALTVALGVFRRIKPRVLLRWHKTFGVAALVSGAAHATLVLLAH